MRAPEIVPTDQAARELRMDAQTLRYLMASGKVQLGDCGRRPGCKRRFYRIYRKLLDEEKAKRGIA